MAAVQALTIFEEHQKLPLSEKAILHNLRAMYRALLNADDTRFYQLQGWLFELTESEAFSQYSEDLQERMLGCLDQYRIENRYPADGRQPDSEWPYLYFLPF